MPAPTARDHGLIHAWWSDLKIDVRDDVRGLWFGIVDLHIDGQSRRTLYVAGCAQFDAGDPVADWAAADYAWWPAERYVDLPDFAALPNHAHAEVLKYAVALVRALAPLPIAAVDGAAVGFDDGDFELI